MFSTGFNSGARAGSSTSVRLSGTTRSLARCHPARSISRAPWAPGATACATSARCRLMACVSHRGSTKAAPLPSWGDRSEDVDRTRPLIVRGAGPGASSGPRAPRPATIVLWGYRSGGPPGSLPRWPGGFFKRLQRLRVLGIVARAGRELAVAERAQFAAQRRLAERDPKLLPDPHCEILQPPANHAVDRRHRPTLNDVHQGLALAVVQLAGVARGLAVDQALRAARVEPHNPVPNGLQPNAANPRCPGPGAAIIDLGQRQQPPTLTRIPGRFR